MREFSVPSLEYLWSHWTHRQFVCALDWIDRQWDHPSRADYYAMQTAAEVRRSWVTKPSRVKILDMLLPFRRKSKAEPGSEVAVQQSKMAWMSAGAPANRKRG